MKQVVEQFRAPNAIEPGPNATFLGFLLVNLNQLLGEMARRVNLTAPKDGSELQQMTSYDSVDYAVTGNVDNADFGYYTVIRCTLTGGSYDLTGVANGAGQEGVGGRLLRIVNTSATGLNLTLKHDATSTAGNRFYLTSGADLVVPQFGSAQLWYDLASLRWRTA